MKWPMVKKYKIHGPKIALMLIESAHKRGHLRLLAPVSGDTLSHIVHIWCTFVIKLTVCITFNIQYAFIFLYLYNTALKTCKSAILNYVFGHVWRTHHSLPSHPCRLCSFRFSGKKSHTWKMKLKQDREHKMQCCGNATCSMPLLAPLNPLKPN